MDCGLGCTEAMAETSCCGSQAPVSSNHGPSLPSLKHERRTAAKRQYLASFNAASFLSMIQSENCNYSCAQRSTISSSED